MASPTYSQAFVTPQKRRCYWAVEKTAAGTAPALSAASTWYSEGIVDIQPSPQRSRYNGNEYVGMPAVSLTSIELNHYTQFSIQVPVRMDGGLGITALAIMMGDHDNTGTAETITGAADPVTHLITPGVKSTREATFSILLDTGTATGADGMLFTYSTISSWQLSFDPNNVLMITLQFTSRWHQLSGMPTTPVAPPNPLRTKSTQGTINIHSNAGAVYTAKPLSGTLTITRMGPEVLFSPANNSLDPLEIAPGALGLSASFDFLYDNMQAGGPYADFMADNPVGATSANANTMTWTDSATNNHSLAIKFWPAKWETMQIVGNQGGQTVHMQGGLTAFQDEASATQASPVFTVVTSVQIINSTTAAIVI